jgi:hypothetical protein
MFYYTLKGTSLPFLELWLRGRELKMYRRRNRERRRGLGGHIFVLY